MKKKVQKSKKYKKNNNKVRKGIFIFLIVSIITVILIYKAPIFNIKEITFSGLVSLKQEVLAKEVEGDLGKNIFSVDYNSIKEKLETNPYIDQVSISRVGINKLDINIKENEIIFYIDDGSKKIINNKLVVVETVENIEGRNLIQLVGIDAKDAGVGDKLPDSNGISKILMELYPVIKAMPEDNRFTSIDLSDVTNIKGVIGEVQIRLGSIDNLIEKMNVALNLINQGVVTKGYIELGYEGPVTFKQEN